MDGRSTTVPVFVQPDSEQECLLGSNVLPSLGITVVRANGESLTASIERESENEPAQVNLVQVTAIPGLRGCYVKAHVDQEQCKGGEVLFEPESKTLQSLGVSALDLRKRKVTDDKISASNLTIGPGTNTYFIEKKLTTALNDDVVPSLTQVRVFLQRNSKRA